MLKSQIFISFHCKATIFHVELQQATISFQIVECYIITEMCTLSVNLTTPSPLSVKTEIKFSQLFGIPEEIIENVYISKRQ